MSRVSRPPHIYPWMMVSQSHPGDLDRLLASITDATVAFHVDLHAVRALIMGDMVGRSIESNTCTLSRTGRHVCIALTDDIHDM